MHNDFAVGNKLSPYSLQFLLHLGIPGGFSCRTNSHASRNVKICIFCIHTVCLSISKGKNLADNTGFSAVQQLNHQILYQLTVEQEKALQSTFLILGTER